jgi:phosphatidylglycerophosphate synthase
MEKQVEARPSILSKITTVAQLLTVCCVLAEIQMPKMAQLHSPLFFFAAAMTTVSGLQYIYRGLNILQEDGTDATV